MNERQEKAYLGKGLAFPLQINARGDIAMTAGEEDIRQAIRIILGTAPGERVMRPEFGCGIHDYVFSPADGSTADFQPSSGVQWIVNSRSTDAPKRAARAISRRWARTVRSSCAARRALWRTLMFSAL